VSSTIHDSVDVRATVSVGAYMMIFHTPTIQEIEVAREAFEANEPRDLFYRAATELVDLAIHEKTSLSVAEAVAVLLQTWNRAYYRYHPFDGEHFANIERLIGSYEQAIMDFRQRCIETFSDGDEVTVMDLFRDFEEVLGPVGAAKCLYLLSPSFFPLWDRSIAEAYGLGLKQRGRNSSQYCRFMRITKEQCSSLGGEPAIGRNPLKALDEYNYCRYTKGWI
jgi:hypothetical protein